MDFLLSSSIDLEDCCVEQRFDFRSDHRPVVSSGTFSVPDTSSRKQLCTVRCPVRWSPSESWLLRVEEFTADWCDPLSTFRRLAQTARRLPPDQKYDFQENLQDLLQFLRRTADLDSRRFW